MTSTKPYLRKKAVLIMYKVFLNCPEALRPAFPRLKEKLEDPDPGKTSRVVSNMLLIHKTTLLLEAQESYKFNLQNCFCCYCISSCSNVFKYDSKFFLFLKLSLHRF